MLPLPRDGGIYIGKGLLAITQQVISGRLLIDIV
jgi:hypothetical protein